MLQQNATLISRGRKVLPSFFAGEWNFDLWIAIAKRFTARSISVFGARKIIILRALWRTHCGWEVAHLEWRRTGFRPGKSFSCDFKFVLSSLKPLGCNGRWNSFPLIDIPLCSHYRLSRSVTPHHCNYSLFRCPSLSPFLFFRKQRKNLRFVTISSRVQRASRIPTTALIDASNLNYARWERLRDDLNLISYSWCQFRCPGSRSISLTHEIELRAVRGWIFYYANRPRRVAELFFCSASEKWRWKWCWWDLNFHVIYSSGDWIGI